MTQVCKYVCFASSVVGLLCYAFSSSFNHLFGKWSLLKIFLYIVFSFIICLAVLFAMVWQHSTSLRLKAHLAFLFLVITSAYSFYFDKVVNGKPDAYSLSSSAAFAIMSLGLSRLSYFGFEVDLLYFFLGSVIVQLMKIKLWLFFVGAGFTYFLVNLRSSLNSPPESGNLGLQHAVVIQVDSPQANTASPLLIMPQKANTNSAPVMTFDTPPEIGHLELQDQGVTQVDSYSQQANTDTDSALIVLQLKACIEKLRWNDWNLVEVLLNHLDEYLKDEDQIPVALVTHHNFVIDALPSEIINDLHETVKLMVAGGFETECLDEYSIWRREFLENCLWNGRLEKHSPMHLDEISWLIKACNVAFRILLPSERRLCDRVFFGLSSTVDLCFMEVCRESTMHLLDFVNVNQIGSHAPTLLYHVFEAFRGLTPEFKSLFSDQYSVSLWNKAIEIQNELELAIGALFKELEDLIRHNTAQASDPGGIYPITRKVMNRLRGVSKDRDTHDQFFQKYPKVAVRMGTSSPLSVHMARIIELLESHLEAQTKNYSDTLGYVFMMNNGRYIEQKAEEYGLVTILGDDWIRKHAAKVQQYLENYQRSSWNEVLGFLQLNSNESVAPKVVAESMEERLSLFNILFEQICSIQSSWFVFDEQLRGKIKIFLEKNLLLAYGNFLGRFQHVLGANDYIKYGIYQVETLLNKLFRGSDSS